MTAFKAYLIGLKGSLSAWRVWVLLYLFNLLFTFTVIAPVAQYLEKKIGHSVLVNELSEGFNYTVMHDFLANYEVSIAAFAESALVITVLYFVWSIFAAGGILRVFLRSESGYRLRNFWGGGTYYFWRMARITFYFLLMQAAVLAVFGGIFWLLAPAEPDSEMQYINLAKIIVPLYMTAAFLTAIWQDFTKILAVRRDEIWLFGTFWATVRFLRKNFGRVFLFSLLNLLTVGLIYLIYRGGSLTFTGMNAVFFFGQILVIGRIGSKLWTAAGGLTLTENQI